MAESSGSWPEQLHLRGVTESIIATRGPNDSWNLAALGLRAPSVDETGAGRVTARTWGDTRTARGFSDRSEGIAQFVQDPRVFVDAALSVCERDSPIHPRAYAWVELRAELLAEGSEDGTRWVDWGLEPTESTVRDSPLPVVNRGHAAVIEATVAVSRLGVEGYDREELLGRLQWLRSVVERAGGSQEREAYDRLEEYASARW